MDLLFSKINKHNIGEIEYNIAKHEDNDFAYYIMYECDSEYTCKKFPFFQYRLTKEEDEQTLSVYVTTGPYVVEGIVVVRVTTEHQYETIFNYDGEPHCYAASCYTSIE